MKNAREERGEKDRSRLPWITYLPQAKVWKLRWLPWTCGRAFQRTIDQASQASQPARRTLDHGLDVGNKEFFIGLKVHCRPIPLGGIQWQSMTPLGHTLDTRCETAVSIGMCNGPYIFVHENYTPSC